MINSKYGSDMPQKLHIAFQLHFFINLTPFGGPKTMFLYALFYCGESKAKGHSEIQELAHNIFTPFGLFWKKLS